jgi:hypothetical protein
MIVNEGHVEMRRIIYLSAAAALLCLTSAESAEAPP